MNKLTLQAVVLVLLFLGMYYSFSKIDWMTLFNIEKLSSDTEQKLGDVFWDLINRTEKKIDDEEIVNSVDSLLSKICNSNNIKRSSINLHILDKDEVNAFALPNRRLVIYSGLILESENEAALCGVISHELAHIEYNHVMKKLIKELGLSVLIGMTAGSGGGEMVRQTLKMLSSTAYDRNLEKEADLAAVEYLNNAELSPESFAEFLYSMDSKSQIPDYFNWVSTHPDSKERAEYILESSENFISASKPILSAGGWERLKIALQ